MVTLGGKLILWDLHSYKVIRSFFAHDDAILCCTLNQSGDKLITGAANETACVWNLNDLQSPIKLEGHSDEVCGCDFADQDYSVTVSADQSIRCWNKFTGSPVAVSRGHAGPITCLSVQPGGQVMYTGATNGFVIAWTIADLGKEEKTSGHGAAVTCAVISRFDKIATSSLDGSVIIWEITDGGVNHRLECQGKVNGCGFNQSGETLITCRSHRPLIEWDCITGNKLRTIPTGMEVITCCASDPEKRILILGTMRGLKVIELDNRDWQIDLTMKSGIQEMQEQWDQVKQRAKNQSFISTQEMRQISHSFDSLNTSRAGLAAANSVAIQAGGPLAAVGDEIGRVTLVDLSSKSIVKEIRSQISDMVTPINSVALTPNGKYLAVGYANGKVVVYSLKEDECIQWQESGSVLACAFSADAHLLAVGTELKHLSVWMWQKRTEIYHLPMTHAVKACAFSHQQPVLVCADAGGDVSIVEMVGLDKIVAAT